MSEFRNCRSSFLTKHQVNEEGVAPPDLLRSGLMKSPCGHCCDSQSEDKSDMKPGAFFFHLQRVRKRRKIKSYPFTQRLAPQVWSHSQMVMAADLLRETHGQHAGSAGDFSAKK